MDQLNNVVYKILDFQTNTEPASLKFSLRKTLLSCEIHENCQMNLKLKCKITVLSSITTGIPTKAVREGVGLD